MKTYLFTALIFNLSSCTEGKASNAAFGLGQFISTTGLIILAIWIVSLFFKKPKSKK